MRRGMISLVLVGPVLGFAAQAPTLEAALARVTGYVARVTPQLANLVASETYEQRTRTSATASGAVVLTSDFLLVPYQPGQSDWIVFRDVAAVDGKRLDRPQDRLVALFTAPGVNATQRAAIVSRESTRFNLPGSSFAVTNPLLVVALMQAHYRPRLRFALGGEEQVTGIRVQLVQFEERDEQSAAAAERDRAPLPPLLAEAGRVRGGVWFERDTGRIVRTEARLGAAPNVATTVTTFAHDERLGLTVPLEMRTTWTYNRRPVNGIAKYSGFRRFAVQSEAQFPQP